MDAPVWMHLYQYKVLAMQNNIFTKNRFNFFKSMHQHSYCHCFSDNTTVSRTYGDKNMLNGHSNTLNKVASVKKCT